MSARGSWLVACGVAHALSAAASTPVAGTDAHAGWFATIAGAVARDEYAISPRREGGWTAPNRAQGLRATWDRGVLVVTPRVDAGAWSFRYELRAVARGAEASLLRPVEAEHVTANRLEWTRGAFLREWYVNDDRGIEQGFVLAQRPAGDAALPVSIDGSIEGLMAHPAEDGQSVVLRNPAGTDAMRIRHLVVHDASGRRLPACLDVAPGVLSIVIDDVGAVYPVTVDPLMTSPAWTAEGDQASAQFGSAVATAGDVNGDGYSDVIVGARLHDNGEADEGRAFVYLGSASGLSTTAAWIAEADQAGAEFGFSVATAGDVNGDGYSDVLVGAVGYADGESGEGGAFLFLGSASGLSATAAWTARGDQVGAGLGNAVATAGDVNGDGLADIIVGAPAYSAGEIQEGRAFVYLGSASGLAALPIWTAESDQAGARFGDSVATAGDVNGDGFADVIVGAYQHDNGEPDEGRAFVYLGSASGLAALPIWTAESDQAGAQFGISVMTAGDVNGDGYADVIVGAPLFDDGELEEGGAFVYLGSPAGPLSAPDWVTFGDQPDARLGSSVGTAGDVNGDGFADVIVGAPGFDGGALDDGRALVHLGSAAGIPAAATWAADGGQAGAALGGAVALAGDVNGDGWSDVILGAEGFDGAVSSSGAALAFHGAAAGLAATAGWTAESDQDGAFLGNSVATAGDVNGDGYSDVIVGASSHDGGVANGGAAFVYHGSASGLATTASWRAEGDQPCFFGISVATAGDVNGDGYSDVIVGAHAHSNGEPSEGRAYVYLGGASGLPPAAAWMAEGNQAGASFGASAATAGDVNGDGYADVVIGAGGYDSGEVDEGRAFVFLGSASGLATSPAWMADGDQVDARFGRSVASAGDVNGDGYTDVVVGAPQLDGGGSDVGSALVYHGSASGLAASSSWRAESDQGGSQFGSSVATAGDVNGDGFSDVVVGAPSYAGGGFRGRAFAYMGSGSGLDATPAWVAASDPRGGAFGHSVAAAGDVNGDGYSDVIVGDIWYSNGQRFEGAAFLFLGSPSGPSTVASWKAEGDQADPFACVCFGSPVATAGDVNGDGYSDVVVGASGYDNGEVDEGRAFLYYGNDGDGLDRIPRQRRFDGSAPIDVLGLGDGAGGFQIHARARSPFGRDRVRLEAEVEPLDIPFDGVALLATPDTDTGAPGPGGSFVDLDVLQASLGPGPHHWRARLRGTFPLPWQGHWMTLPYNAVTETDLRVVPPPCDEPSALDLRPAAAPLLVATAALPDTVALAWENISAPRYDVYGGDIADLAPARPQPVQVACGVVTSFTDVPAPGPGRWFVVVASCGLTESSYGRDSFGRERDRAVVPCP